MSASQRYRKIRKGLGFLAAVIMIFAFSLGFAFTSNGTEEQRASLAYNLGIIVAVAWAYSSGIAKYLMLEGCGKHKLLNIIGLSMLAILLILEAQIPYRPTPPGFLYVIYSSLTSLWVISWAALDICEIVF